MYTSGAYREQILLAMRERAKIDGILDRFRTKGRTAASTSTKSHEDEGVASQEAIQGSGAAVDDDGTGAAGYFPYKPYCAVCDRDHTTVTAYDDTSTELTYICLCGHAETVLLSEHNSGKLVWKVDWPMRWAYEGVVFEPSGVDHSTPGSSFQVGSELVGDIFGGRPPIGPMYAFVGIAGMPKMSSSRGAVPTPADALQIVEPPVLRWMYARRRPQQAFKIAFDQEVHRLYDEWDAMGRSVAASTATAADAAAYARGASTATGSLPVTPHPLPYRTLASIVDITTGDPEQTLRILQDLDPGDPVASLGETRPRLDCAQRWVKTQLPAEQRTRVLSVPDIALLDKLDDDQRESLDYFLARLPHHWSLDGLTTLVYGVPKARLGLPMDVKPTPDLKLAQREFFALLYTLLVGRDTGPRLATLLLAIGQDHVRALLSGEFRESAK